MAVVTALMAPTDPLCTVVHYSRSRLATQRHTIAICTGTDAYKSLSAYAITSTAEAVDETKYVLIVAALHSMLCYISYNEQCAHLIQQFGDFIHRCSEDISPLVNSQFFESIQSGKLHHLE